MHFPAKEELLFDATLFTLDGLSKRLSERGPHESALEALRDWDDGHHDTGRDQRVRAGRTFLGAARLGERTSSTPSPGSAACARASNHPFERILAQAIGQDLGQPANALIPRLAALSAVAGLRELYESDEAHALAAPPSAAELLTLVDRVICFARAGIEGAR